MGTTSEKLTYLNTTKEKIRDSINLTGANIGTSDTFRSYASKLNKGYIDIINNGIDTLYNNFPKVSGIGSNLSLTPTYEAPMKLNEIQGDTLQNGTPTPNTPVEIQSVTGLQNVEVCGKNLLPPKASTSTKNGVTFTKNNDGTYTVNGTATANAVFSILAEGNTTNPTLSTGTYTLSGCPSDGASNTYKLDISVGGYNQDIGNGVTFTLNQETQINYARILVYNGQTINKVFKPMLEKSSIATTYEPYKGNNYEVNLGKNLFDETKITSVTNGTYSDEIITSNIMNDNPFNLSVFNSLILSTGTYYISADIRLVSGSTTFSKMNDGIKDGTIISYPTLSNKFQRYIISQTYNSTTNIQRLLFQFTNSTNAVVEIKNIQLEKGSQATSYSPYFTPIELNKIGDYKDSIKKSTGKNLFDKDNTSITSGAYINSSTGEIISGGTSSVINNISVISNTTYTLTAVGKNKIAFYDSNNNYLSNITSNLTTFTTPANCKYIKIQLATETLDINTIQLEIGSTATSYEPYGKVWYVEKQIGKVVLNGSENWSTHQFGTNSFQLSFPDVKSGGDYITILSSHFKGIPYTNRNTGNNIIYNDAQSSISLIIRNTGFATLNDFKTWLSTHNTTVYYVLATPTYTEITNTELIEDLETLYTAKSQEGTTNISITSEDLEMILNVSALKGEV